MLDVTVDGGRSWQQAALQEPRLPLALTRFRLPWRFNGDCVSPAAMMWHPLIMGAALVLLPISGVLAMFGLGWPYFSFGTTLVGILFLERVTASGRALSRFRRDFEQGKNTRTERFYRILNEVPAVLMAAIVVLVVVKPF